MKRQRLVTIEVAERMHTGHAQLDRLLDPNIDEVQLNTLPPVAATAGRWLGLRPA